MQKCENSCPKLNQQLGSSPGLRSQTSTVGDSSNTKQTEGPNGNTQTGIRSLISNRRSLTQSQKSVQIAGLTAVQVTNSGSTGSSEKTPSSTGRDQNSGIGETSSWEKNQSQHQSEERDTPAAGPKAFKNRDQVQERLAARESPQRSEPSTNYGRMTERGRSSSTSGEVADWDSNQHNPCTPNCAMTKAKERAIRKAELRQERLDDYLLNKGFSYFDDLCICSSICLITQLRRDTFVLDILKSVCLFGLGMKLCDELDAWNIFN